MLIDMRNKYGRRILRSPSKKKATRERIREFGKKGDTYDDVVMKLMDEEGRRRKL